MAMEDEQVLEEEQPEHAPDAQVQRNPRLHPSSLPARLGSFSCNFDMLRRKQNKRFLWCTRSRAPDRIPKTAMGLELFLWRLSR